jgi:hypothetical protein
MFNGDIAAGPVPTLFAENVDEARNAIADVFHAGACGYGDRHCCGKKAKVSCNKQERNQNGYCNLP